MITFFGDGVLKNAKAQEQWEIQRNIIDTFRALKNEDKDVGALTTELNLWLQYEERLKSARTWPYNTAMLRTLFMSVLFPIIASQAQRISSPAGAHRSPAATTTSRPRSAPGKKWSKGEALRCNSSVRAKSSLLIGDISSSSDLTTYPTWCWIVITVVSIQRVVKFASRASVYGFICRKCRRKGYRLEATWMYRRCFPADTLENSDDPADTE